MNPRQCYVCKDPCKRVCVHPECKHPAYCCSGECDRQMSNMIHSHSNTSKYLPVEQFDKKLMIIQKSLDPYALHNLHLNQMNKLLILVKQYLHDQINTLDQMFEQHRKTLYSKELRLRLRQNLQQIKIKIDDDKSGKTITGKMLNEYIMNQDKYQNQFEIFDRINQLKEDFENGLNQFMNLNFRDYFKGNIKNEEFKNEFKKEQQRILFVFAQQKQKPRKEYRQGRLLQRQNRYREALHKFNQANRQENNNNQTTDQRIKQCQVELKKLKDQQKKFEAQILRASTISLPIFESKFTVYRQAEVEKAIQFYQDCIKKDPQDPEYFAQLGFYQFQNKEYENALASYCKAGQLKPRHPQYLRQIQKIANLIQKQSKK